MLFVLLGVVLIVLKLLDYGAVGVWSGWVVLSPFALAIVWWTWADMSGYTKKRAMDKMDEKKVARRQKALSALGLDYRAFDRQKKKAADFKASRQRVVEMVESKREAQRRKNRDSILHSRFEASSQMSQFDSTQQGTDSKP